MKQNDSHVGTQKRTVTVVTGLFCVLNPCFANVTDGEKGRVRFCENGYAGLSDNGFAVLLVFIQPFVGGCYASLASLPQ